MKKLLALILAMAMSLSCVSLNVLAAELPAGDAAEVAAFSETEAVTDADAVEVDAPAEDTDDASKAAPAEEADEAAPAEETDEAAPAEDVDVTEVADPNGDTAAEGASEAVEGAEVTEEAVTVEENVSDEAEEAVEPLAAPEYVLMNIPYAEFYQGEGTVDVVSGATAKKRSNAGLAGGSYHLDADSSDITGVTFPVKVNGVDLSAYTQADSEAALFENASYAYVELTEAPAVYKELNADGTFSAVKGEKQSVDASVSLMLTDKHADYVLKVDGLTIDENVNAVVLTDDQGKVYGLRHVNNIWRKTELGWNKDDASYASLTGRSVKKVTYITTKGIYEISTDVAVSDVVYVLMNIPYGEFYKGEKVSNSVDAVSSATKNKTRTGGLAGGSYHVNADGSDITGIIYPVKVNPADLSGYKEITDSDSVEITVTNRGQTSTTTYSGKDALFEAPSYAYYTLTEKPKGYKVLENGSFSAVKGLKAKDTASLTASASAAVKANATHADVEISIDSFTLPEGEQLNAAILTTEDGKTYGLRHVCNIWRNGLELGWNDDDEGYEALSGATITKISYITQKGLYEITTNVYVPVNPNARVSVADAEAAAGFTEVTVTGLPADFDAVYTVARLADAAVADGKLTYTVTPATFGSYTLTVTDKAGKYASFSTSFTLTTDAMPAAFDSESKALVAADGASADALRAYLSAISKVTVDGKDYAASGRGAVILIDSKTGAVKTDAEAFAEKKVYQVTVAANGVTPTLSFALDLRTEQTITANNVTKTFGDKAFHLDARAQTALSYQSDNTKVADVDGEGKVTIKGAGIAKITITAAETDTCKAATKTITVTVNKAAQTITAQNVTKTFGDKAFNLNAKAQTALSYTSSDKKVVTVDKNGKVTIQGGGTARITISAAETDTCKAASKTITVTVNKAAQTITVKNVTKVLGDKAFSLGAKAKTALSYTSSDKKVVTVDKNGKVTVKGVGTAKITVNAKATANYKAAERTVTITVNPKGVALSKVAAGKKQLTVNWKKNTAVTGYEIQYATTKDFKGAKSVKVKNAKTVKTTIKKLTSKKKYYVRIRTYKTVSKKTYSSSWSKAMTATVK